MQDDFKKVAEFIHRGKFISILYVLTNSTIRMVNKVCWRQVVQLSDRSTAHCEQKLSFILRIFVNSAVLIGKL